MMIDASAADLIASKPLPSATEKLALELARISYAVSTFGHLPTNQVPAAHRSAYVVWSKQLKKPSCELIELLMQLVGGAESLLERARWAYLSDAIAAVFREWRTSRDPESVLVKKLVERITRQYSALAPGKTELGTAARRGHQRLQLPQGRSSQSSDERGNEMRRLLNDLPAGDWP